MMKKKKNTLESSTPKRIIVNVRKVIDQRLRQLKKSRLWLAQQIDERPATIYDFLNDPRRNIQSDKLEAMLGVLGLEIRVRD